MQQLQRHGTHLLGASHARRRPSSSAATNGSVSHRLPGAAQLPAAGHSAAAWAGWAATTATRRLPADAPASALTRCAAACSPAACCRRAAAAAATCAPTASATAAVSSAFRACPAAPSDCRTLVGEPGGGRAALTSSRVRAGEGR